MRLNRFIILAMVMLITPVWAGTKTVEETRSRSKYGNHPGAFKKKQFTESLRLYGASPADTVPFMNKLKAVETLFASHRLLSNLKGYNAYGSMGVYRPEEYSNFFTGRPLVGKYSIVVHEFGSGPGGKPAETITSAGVVSIEFNGMRGLFEGQAIYTSGIGTDLYYQPERIGTFRGHSVYNSNRHIIFMNASSRPMWVPVSSEEFIGICIKRTEAERDETMKELKGKTLGPKEIVSKGKAERQKSFNEAYLMLKKMNPAEAEKAKREFEENEKRFAEEASSRNETSDDIRSQHKKMYDDRIAGLRAELASLSQSRKKAPAVFAGESEDRPSGLGDGDGKPVVRINREYFTDGKPRGAVRCISVKYGIHGQYNPDEFDWTHEGDSMEAAVILEFHSTIDWKSIASLLDR
ncbi:MAG: hypothetical protein MUD12_06215 [Spirochaetes bacterium]|jgi:hypothetical protein|nr:hypothetical protein [Spirochaetota bacterium]